MPADYSEILHTDLFSAAPEASVEFQHQQYAEFLAAEYLVERQITPGQLRGLLRAQGDGLVPAPMVAVASWAAALRPALAKDFIAPNALAFAQAGIELPSPDARAVIVAGLLDAAANGEADPVPGTILSPWRTRDLRSNCHVTSVTASRIQASCGGWRCLQPLAGARGFPRRCCGRRFRARWPDWARRGAVTAVAVLGDVEEHCGAEAASYPRREEDPATRYWPPSSRCCTTWR